MRTKQLLQAVQTVGSDIQILLNYLDLSGLSLYVNNTE